MNRHTVAFFAAVLSTMLAVCCPTQAQQSAQPSHKYLFVVQFNSEGMKDLQKQTATVRRTQVSKFNEALGCKLETWYFDYNDSTAYVTTACLDESGISTPASQANTNSTGFVRVIAKPLLSAEDLDKAFAKASSIRPIQQQ